MYTITLSHDGAQQLVSFGLSPKLPFSDLAHAFELVQADVEARAFAPSTADAEWGKLRMVENCSLTLGLQRDGESWLLYVDDANTGDDTSTGVNTLAEAFAFAAYWAMVDFE
jgi:hypothetical protein